MNAVPEKLRQDLMTTPVWTEVAICLGANLGDREGTIRRAAAMLGAGPLRDVRLSAMLDNPPWDCAPDAPAYLNAAVVGRTQLTPEALLAACMQIELALGRDRSAGYHADRTIDIDIALYGDTTLTTPDLTLPHPGVADRDFFLIPLAELAPHWPVPGIGKTVDDLLKAL